MLEVLSLYREQKGPNAFQPVFSFVGTRGLIELIVCLGAGTDGPLHRGDFGER